MLPNERNKMPLSRPDYIFDSQATLNLPMLTGDMEGIGGSIRHTYDDFLVEEVPLYKASGSGTHSFILIEKRGITTSEAIRRLAIALGVPHRLFGAAGLKDARAVTRQWISVEHVEPEQILQLQIPRVTILGVRRHENKLKIGHLKSNRFIIKVRNVKEPLDQSAVQAEKILALLERRGAPNYFGPQRFGNRQNTHLLGRAVIKGQPEEFMDLFLGRPQAWDIPAIVTACTFYEQGDYEKAMESWPMDFREQRHTLKILMKYKLNKKKTYKSLDNRLKGFFISSFQSYIFNKVIAARMPAIDKVFVGDMAYKHDNGACFYIEDAQKEQPRCDNFEISPTGPLIGHRMARLSGLAGDIENPVLEEVCLDEQDFTRMKRFGGRGGRRPIRFQPHDWQIKTGQDETSPFLEFHFELDSGCYATSLLREITKSDIYGS